MLSLTIQRITGWCHWEGPSGTHPVQLLCAAPLRAGCPEQPGPVWSISVPPETAIPSLHPHTYNLFQFQGKNVKITYRDAYTHMVITIYLYLYIYIYMCLALKSQQHWPVPPVQMEDSHKFVPFPTEPWAATPLITIGAPLDAGLHMKMQQNQRAPERGRAESCYLHQTQNDEPKDKLEPRKHHYFLKNYSGSFSSCQYKLLVYTPITTPATK